MIFILILENTDRSGGGINCFPLPELVAAIYLTGKSEMHSSYAEKRCMAGAFYVAMHAIKRSSGPFCVKSHLKES